MLGSQAFPLARIVGACNRLIGSYVFTFSGGIRRRCPEVHFEEIAIDLLQARFWIASGWPTIRPEWPVCSELQPRLKSNHTWTAIATQPDAQQAGRRSSGVSERSKSILRRRISWNAGLQHAG
jgi:hypothetical protein